MFEIHVGSTPCELSTKDYRTLASKSDGYVVVLLVDVDVHIFYQILGL